MLRGRWNSGQMVYLRRARSRCSSRYNSLLDWPSSRARRLRASFSSMPASAWRRATRSASLLAAAGSGLRPVGRAGASTSSVISPRMRSRAASSRAHVGYGSAQKLLVDLGQFAGNDDAQLRSPDGFEIGQCLENAVRRLVEDQRAAASRAASAASSSSRVRRAPAFSGRNPRN